VTGRREIAIGLGAYAAYLAVRALVWNDRGRARALRNAERISELERRSHLDVERRVQATALRWPRLVHVLNAGYAAGNVMLSVGWLLLLFARRDAAFARERRAAVVAFTAALPVFALVPTAPPRRLEGFVDTMRGLDHPLLVRCYNPIAAMPSHHVAFAVVTGFGLAGRSRSRLGRAAWSSYPAAVTLVVIATANHFVLDAIGGVAIGTVARRVTR
jgi:hypothetical protein